MKIKLRVTALFIVFSVVLSIAVYAFVKYPPTTEDYETFFKIMMILNAMK